MLCRFLLPWFSFFTRHINWLSHKQQQQVRRRADCKTICIKLKLMSEMKSRIGNMICYRHQSIKAKTENNLFSIRIIFFTRLRWKWEADVKKKRIYTEEINHQNSFYFTINRALHLTSFDYVRTRCDALTINFFNIPSLLVA